MANWRKTRTPGVYVAHSKRCPAFDDVEARCRCTPSWRGRRWNADARRAEWQSPSTKDRAEVLSWLGATRKGADRLAEIAAVGWTFEAIGDEWLDGVEAGRIGRRRGRGKSYSPTTIEDYRRSYRHFLRREFGPMVADEI